MSALEGYYGAKEESQLTGLYAVWDVRDGTEKLECFKVDKEGILSVDNTKDESNSGTKTRGYNLDLMRYLRSGGQKNHTKDALLYEDVLKSIGSVHINSTLDR